MHCSQPLNLRTPLSYLMQEGGYISAVREMLQRGRDLLRIAQTISETEPQRSIRWSLSLWKLPRIFAKLPAYSMNKTLVKRRNVISVTCYRP